MTPTPPNPEAEVPYSIWRLGSFSSCAESVAYLGYYPQGSQCPEKSSGRRS